MEVSKTYITFTCRMNIKETEKAYGFYDRNTKTMQFLPKSLTRLKHNENGTTEVSVIKWLYDKNISWIENLPGHCSKSIDVIFGGCIMD